jgi:hypothetical protein
MVTCANEVRAAQAAMSKLGVRATPSFFINGRFTSGARPVADFASLIDEELAKANDRIAQGTPKAKYYEEWVLERGLPELEPPTAGP